MQEPQPILSTFCHGSTKYNTLIVGTILVARLRDIRGQHKIGFALDRGYVGIGVK
jgi:hypothetical protein